jgi:hypothetical protein
MSFKSERGDRAVPHQDTLNTVTCAQLSKRGMMSQPAMMREVQIAKDS